MKKNFYILTVFSAILIIVLIYLFKTYNPTTYNWKTDLVTYLTKLTDIVYFPHYFKPHSLSVYELTLNPDNYVALNQNLPDPNKTNGILSDKYKQYVPAKFTYQGEEYDIQVRYRGFDFDHWTRQKKSWRIKFKDSQPFFNQTAINLIIPEDRGMYLEELSNYRAKKLGLIVPDSQFVILKVNGQTQGVYWLVEHWTPAFLEKKQLPVGNLYGDIDQMVSRDQQKSIYQSISFWKKYVKDEIYKDDNYAEISMLLDLLNNASDQEFFRKLPLLVDIDNLLAWQAHSVLMGSVHQDSIHNIRFYWHPALGKFYVFPWDVLGGRVSWPIDYHPLVARVLKNPDWLNQRNQILTDYVSNPDNLQQDLDYYDQLINQTKTAIFQDYRKFFSNFGYIQQTSKTRQQIIDQFQLIKKSLADNSLPNETSGFSFPSQETTDINQSDKLIVDGEFKDFDKLFTLQSQTVVFGSGIHYLNQTIIVQSGHDLIIYPGATLIMAPDVSLVSFGQVKALGTASQPITITAKNQEKPWGVFAVIGNKQADYYFNHLIIEHGSEAVINGAYFTGALAVHQAGKVIIENSIFRYNHGDDGLNIKYADVQVNNSKFLENDFDGFDLDFGNGQIKNNTFINNGNDGLDLGSASPLIQDNLVDTAGDKCISLGETSSPKITNNVLKNCNMAIAVKDSSQPEITKNQISDNHIGLASYIKKPIFPRLPFIFNNNLLENNEIDFEEEDASLRKKNL